MRPLSLTVRAAEPGERYDRLNEVSFRQEVARVIESLPALFDRRYLNTGAGTWYDVKTFGALGDGETDDAAAISAAITAAVAAGGGTIYFPPGVYLVGASLSWTGPGVTLQGAGMDLTELRDHPDLGANRVIFLQGTAEAPIERVAIRDLSIRNGTAPVGARTNGKDGIRIEHVHGFTMWRTKIHEIQGNFGLVTKYSRDIGVSNCLFYRWAYAGMAVLVECENVRVRDSTFDTAVSEATINSYTFMTGAEGGDQDAEFLVRDVWVENCRFLNNPRWEGLDTHGGENIYFLNNHIENCKRGILLSMSDALSQNPALRNVHAIGNKIIQGTGLDHGEAIYVGGANDGSKLAEAIYVERNDCIGFGSTDGSGTAAIKFEYAKHVKIKDNNITHWRQAAIMPYRAVYDFEITGNRIGEMGPGSGSPAATAAIFLRSHALVGGWIDENSLTPDTEAGTPNYFLRRAGDATGVQLGQNHIRGVAIGFYSNNGALPVDHTTEPIGLMLQKFGDVILNPAGQVGWYVTAVGNGGQRIGLGSANSTSIIVTADIEAGSKTATVTAANGDIAWIPPGTNITIAGAGAGGADLDARVLSNDMVDTLVLDTAAETTVVGANVTYQPLTFTAA